MTIFIVYSHPGKNSYTYQVLQRIITVLEKESWEILLSDLYEMDFRSDMTGQEYEREGFARTDLPIADDVRLEHQKIENADCILFVYPVWWSDCPAKLKGWFDRVYSVGYAYGYGESAERMKTISLGMAICTAGHPNHFLTETGLAQSMQNVMLNDRLGKRFAHKEMLILGGTLALENVKKDHFQRIDELPKTIKRYCN